MSPEKARESEEKLDTTTPAQALRDLSAPCSPEEAVARLLNASRRGRLAGFHPHPGSHTFHIRIFGEPFDRHLQGAIEAAPGGSRVLLRLKTLPLLPTIFIVFTVFTIWPGVWLTVSMFETYYPPAKNWWWLPWAYILVTAVPLPWAGRKMWRKSQATAGAETAITIEKLEAAFRSEPKSGGSGVHNLHEAVAAPGAAPGAGATPSPG